MRAASKRAKTVRKRRWRKERGKKGAVSPTGEFEAAGDQRAAAARARTAEVLAELEVGRGRDGRFTKGAKPGPGRPRKEAEPERVPWDAVMLFLRGMSIRDTHDAWRQLVRGFEWPVVLQLAGEVLARGDVVPEFVLEYLGCDSVDELRARRVALGVLLESSSAGGCAGDDRGDDVGDVAEAEQAAAAPDLSQIFRQHLPGGGR